MRRRGAVLKRHKNAKKRRPGWFGGLCVTVPAGGQGKKHTEEPVKRETGRAGIKIASPFTTSLQFCKNWNQNCLNVLQFLLTFKLGI